MLNEKKKTNDPIACWVSSATSFPPWVFFVVFIFLLRLTQMEEGSNGLEGLPYELLWCVMVHLPVRDLLLGLALASRRFHLLAAVAVKRKPTEDHEEDEGKGGEKEEHSTVRATLDHFYVVSDSL